jgi:hypothetical protein
MSEQIRNFTERFFQNLKCDLKWEGEALVVDNVPQDFQKFFGKNAPYKLSFVSEIDGADFITKGSYLLKAMNEFLTDKGQTALLKIDFDVDFKEMIEKKFPLRNCEIIRVNKIPKNNVFVRFTFLTSFQYLNEREQVMTSVYVRDGKIIEMDLSEFQTSGGNKRDIKIENVDEEYALAKGKLKEILEPKIQEVGNNLNSVLEKEIERVKIHYGKQTSEVMTGLNRFEERIRELEERRGQVGGMELIEVEAKIKKLREEIVNLKERTEFDKLKKEEEFFIENEIKKHGLSIKNKLLNTTIVYYPDFKVNLFLKSAGASRMIEFNHNPLDDLSSSFSCESCGKELGEIIICSSGHLTCRNCGSKCECCDEVYCDKCSSHVCEECGKKICSKCSLKCSICGKMKCKTHVGKDPITQRAICQNCLKRCSSCGKLVNPEYVKPDPISGMDVCQKCLGKQISREAIKDIFKDN